MIFRNRPPAAAARSTDRLLAAAGPGPGRLLELGGAGIHAVPLALAGWTVVVADVPVRALQAHERAGEYVDAIVEVDPRGTLPFADAEFDVVAVEPGGETPEAARVGRRVVE